METEQWKQIEEFPDYQVSNFGRVRSSKRRIKDKVLIHSFDQRGYPKVTLIKQGKSYCRRIHVLVWDAYGDKPRNGRLINVDHIDFNKSNNWISNLQILSARDNKIKSLKKSGKLLGASSKRGYFFSRIYKDGEYKYLGSFKTELEAHEAYMKEKNAL